MMTDRIALITGAASGIGLEINNAGKQYISPIEEFPSDQFELLIKLMLTAPFFAIKHVFRS